MNFRKIGLIILFVGVTAGAAYLLYRLFFAPAPSGETPGTTPGTSVPGSGLPTAGTGRPTTPGETGPGGFGTAPTTPGGPAPTETAQGGPTVTERISGGVNLAPLPVAGGLNFYNADEGRFYRQLPDGRLELMSEKNFPQATSVEWSPGADKALLQFPDRSKVIFNFATQRQVTLPQHWEDFSWTGDGQMLVAKAIGVDPNNRWLITVNADGSGAKLVEPLGNNSDKVVVKSSPDAQVIAFSQTGDAAGFDTKEILLIGQNQENFKALRIEGFGFEPLWTPDGQSLIYSTASAQDGYRPSLWFVNAKGDTIGGNRSDLGINTWADKCSFATATVLYCAVPDTLPTGAGLERGVANGVPDSIYRVDIVSGATTAIGRPETNTTIKQLSVSPDQSKLYYLDAAGNLAEMRLR